MPVARAEASAFSVALPTKLSSVSSGSAKPSSPADTGSIPNGPSSAAISRTLPALWLAMTSGPGSSLRGAIRLAPRHFRLHRENLVATDAREAEHAQQPL